MKLTPTPKRKMGPPRALLLLLLLLGLAAASLVEELSDEALLALKRRVDAAWRARQRTNVLRFAYPHKQTFATSDPAAAARFVRDMFGGHVIITNTSRPCDDGSLSGYTHIVNFDATDDAPNGFSVHFVYNPHKPPQQGTVPGTEVNASSLGDRVEAWRAGFERGFDQFMDTHLGLAYESLDPLVELWTNRGIPFICRTWCCDGTDCPDGKINTDFCEQGCYVEVPHGIILEALCGLGGGIDAARRCLTKATASVFDLCSAS